MKQKYYKKGRIGQPRTAREIRRYLRRQAWYKSFRWLVWVEEDRTLRDKIRTLLGRGGALTISGAFDWSVTVQGRTYWQIVNERFTAWYVGK